MEHQTQTLPDDIVFDILSRLPVKTLCCFKLVCKPWEALLTHPHFIKSHLKRSNRNPHKLVISNSGSSIYSFDLHSPKVPKVHFNDFPHDPLVIESSCYGLLLIRPRMNKVNCLFLFNPSTRSSRTISLPDNSKPDTFMLSYDSTSDDFKVVAFQIMGGERPMPFYVFSIKKSSWNINICEQDFLFLSRSRKDYTVLAGVPYWVVLLSDKSNSNLGIVYFDPSEDTMKKLPSPEFEDQIMLTALDGNLCVVVDYGSKFDVWLMKESSWSKMFSLPRSFYDDSISPFLSSEDHRIWNDRKPSCFAEENDGEAVILIIYDFFVKFNRKNNTLEWIEVPPAFRGKFLDAECYVESLVSPYFGFGITS